MDKLVNNARRHASTEQLQVGGFWWNFNEVILQADLRLYLKIVQNAMIELINDDYAQFVNLSSSLVNLQTTLEKVDADFQQVCFCLARHGIVKIPGLC